MDKATQIREAFDRDQASGAPPVVSAEQLPLAYEALTDAWLTDALCGEVPGAAVIGHELGPVDNGSSNRRKIGVRYNEAGTAAGLPEKLFCKASHDLTTRFVLGMSGAAEFEAGFYDLIRPKIDIEAPVGVYGKVDTVSYNSLIMLVDISGEVIEFCDDRTKMSRARAESQMRNLARLHGPGYANEKVRAEFGQFIDWPSFFQRTVNFGLEDGCKAGFQDGKDVIPPRLFARAGEVWPATLRSVQLHHELAQTLCHGDVHLKNWYVAGNGEMGLSDWQCVHIGHWSRDVAYTISTALSVEDRRAWERDLLALYVDELAANGGPKVALDEATLRYRQQLMTALAWWTITLHPAPGLPDMQPRGTTLEFVRRIATAVDDNASLDSLAS